MWQCGRLYLKHFHDETTGYDVNDSHHESRGILPKPCYIYYMKSKEPYAPKGEKNGLSVELCVARTSAKKTHTLTHTGILLNLGSEWWW